MYAQFVLTGNIDKTAWQERWSKQANNSRKSGRGGGGEKGVLGLRISPVLVKSFYSYLDQGFVKPFPSFKW